MYKKLLEIQREIGAIKKDSTNPFFKSKYFDINSLLDEVKPVLNKHNIVLLQPLSETNGKPSITTTLIDADTGEASSWATILPESVDAQKAGSAITYYRRYALQSLLALQAEDDDANIATGNKTVPSNIKYPKDEPKEDNYLPF